ncbi:hypothetical protein SP6_43_01020 [Sphingomonas paucimobilis NBRC 13935]|uniref:DNA, contig: SP643 n=1 Tax=Sphingomonas paucimobilis NBRC 13935 TaxID=1219050 RepID=A0A0C9NIS9_SPHPI|nr:hypothetical protein SP6_43_01020 [Sphingomonas paucimobilis NBRC 13935]
MAIADAVFADDDIAAAELPDPQPVAIRRPFEPEGQRRARAMLDQPGRDIDSELLARERHEHPAELVGLAERDIEIEIGILRILEEVEHSRKRVLVAAREQGGEVRAKAGIMRFANVDPGLGVVDQFHRGDDPAEHVGLGDGDGQVERRLGVAIGHGALRQSR